MKRFQDLTSNELWKLRTSITLNVKYDNNFGYNEYKLANFFESYYDYIWELAEEKYANVNHELVIKEFDNEVNLYSWFNCFDELDFMDTNPIYEIGASCHWNYPNIDEYDDVEDARNRIFKIISIGDNDVYENDDDIIVITDGFSEVEVYSNEIEIV